MCRKSSEIFNDFRSSSMTHKGTEGKLSGECRLQDRCARGTVLRMGARKHVTV